MRAVVVDRPGDLDQLKIQDLPEPNLRAGEVLVDVAYGACNWGDIQKRQGIYPDPVVYPTILGGEVSGYVRRRGPGVEALEVGQPVAALTGRDMLRGFADKVAIPHEFIIPLPPSMDIRAAAAFPVASLTAFHLLHTAHQIRQGEAILIHAIGGAVGLALTQLARQAGAHIIGTVGTKAKAQRPLEYGAHRVITRDTEDFVAAVMEETDGRGADLVIDSLGADILPRSFDALRPFGRVINIGEAAGEPDFPIRKKLYERSTSLSGFELIHAEPGSLRWQSAVQEIVAIIEQGQLQMPIAREFLLEDIRDAQAYLEDRGASGKVLIKVGNKQ
ncbi:quinone oxidoreductase family protein [Microvirga aerophila]|uniref:NADPH:quinone reductase n=1 Tax=Microvirga aerophila TaxID=670291 RepID=A0A512BSY6_9HYPH|nr:NADPH:quinone reductase [Microvirga aerophila]